MSVWRYTKQMNFDKKAKQMFTLESARKKQSKDQYANYIEILRWARDQSIKELLNCEIYRSLDCSQHMMDVSFDEKDSIRR